MASIVQRNVGGVSTKVFVTKEPVTAFKAVKEISDLRFAKVNIFIIHCHSLLTVNDTFVKFFTFSSFSLQNKKKKFQLPLLNHPFVKKDIMINSTQVLNEDTIYTG